MFVTEEEQPAERVTFKSIRLEFSNGDTSETKFPTHLVEGSKTHGICARRPEHPYPSTMLYFDRLEPSFATKEVVYVFKERAKPAAEEGATL